MTLTRVVGIASQEGLSALVHAARGKATREVAERVPRVAFHVGLQYKHLKNRVRYRSGSVADPLAELWVNPAEIEYTATKPRRISQHTGPGYVLGGEWDEDRKPIEEHPLHLGLRQRYVQEMDWEETVYFSRAKRAFEQDGEYWNYTGFDEFIRHRTAYVDELFQSLSTDGYRTADTCSESDIDQNRHEGVYHARVLEPVVGISGDGAILLLDGFHRFALSQILEIELAVTVLVRHREWQSVREAVARADPGEIADEFTEHPDLQDLMR